MPDLGTIIAIALLVLAAVVAVRLIVKRSKGKAGCGCGCEGCDTSLALINGEEPVKTQDLPPCCRGVEPRIVEK